MSQPVKLSDALVLDARLAAEPVERSIAGQIEFWARLGRSVDLLLDGRQVLTICRNATARPLSACLESVDTPAGRQRIQDLLANGPFPHYHPHPDRPGQLIRIAADGTRTIGRFVNRKFIATAASSRRKRTGSR